MTDSGEAGSAIDVSVVVATYNREALITTLLQELAKQSFPKDRFEVVVVDDGSEVDPTPRLRSLRLPYRLQAVRQTNRGAAVARDHGISLARGSIVVVIDDDMKVPTDFVERHVAHHAAKPHAVVLGRIRPDESLPAMPIFERFHALMLEKMAEGFRRGEKPRGVDLFTGNVSFRRDDYLVVGGFDRSLGHSEDAELGIRLEKFGAAFVFAEDAYSIHGSDLQLEKWMRRGPLYGMYDRRIAQKHPDYPGADPWRFIDLVNPLSRPLLALAVVAPSASKRAARGLIRVAMGVDKIGLQRLGIAGTTLVFGMEYFRGLREECGSLGTAIRDYRAYRQKIARARHETP
jgi:glycosyltransferase involved in cell wall biosynthesis